MSTAGAGFGTELPTMQQAAQHVDSVNQQIQGQLNKLMQELAPLANVWKGQAAGSFQNLQNLWHDNAQTLSKALQGISEGLARSHQTYQTHEASNVHDLSRVVTNLD